MITYKRLRKHPRTFLCFTGLKIEEFDKLLPSFQSGWNNFIYRYFIKGRTRQRKYGGGNKPNLEAIEDKLVFILAYYKTYPLQIVKGLLFDLDESNANRWIHRLSGVLNDALGYEKKKPARKPKDLDEILKECPELKDLLIDGTERRIKRYKDKKKQKAYYSGKKNTHTVKNILMAKGNREVLYLSKTTEGKKHDKKVLEEEDISFPEGTRGLGDLGFEGCKPLGLEFHHPKKKPKGKPLTPLEKEQNRAFSSIRILVEHAIAGIKISRITQDTYRNYKDGFEDEAIEVATGLHNYRVAHRIR